MLYYLVLQDAVRVPMLWLRYNYDSTSIRRAFDCLAKVIKVTVT